MIRSATLHRASNVLVVALALLFLVPPASAAHPSEWALYTATDGRVFPSEPFAVVVVGPPRAAGAISIASGNETVARASFTVPLEGVFVWETSLAVVGTYAVSLSPANLSATVEVVENVYDVLIGALYARHGLLVSQIEAARAVLQYVQIGAGAAFLALLALIYTHKRLRPPATTDAQIRAAEKLRGKLSWEAKK